MAKPTVFLPKHNFTNYFVAKFHPNNASNFEKSVNLFYLGYAKDQYSSIVMNTFKGQNNAEIKVLCFKHNLTMKFQPLAFQSAKKLGGLP